MTTAVDRSLRSVLAGAEVTGARRDAEGIVHAGRFSEVSGYDEADLDLLAHDGSASWWHRHRATWAAASLRSAGIVQLLEVGAGNGTMAADLRDRGFDVAAMEPHLAGARRIAAAGVPALRGTLADFGFGSGSVPALGYFDVLEHLDDPAAELAEAARVLRPGGLLLVTVPAHRWLWSDEDVRAGHRTRYDRRSLAALIEPAGFRLLRAEHLFGCLVLPVLLTRRLPLLLGRSTPPARSRDRLARSLRPASSTERTADAVLTLERRLARITPLPLGTSVAAVFRRLGD